MVRTDRMRPIPGSETPSKDLEARAQPVFSETVVKFAKSHLGLDLTKLPNVIAGNSPIPGFSQGFSYGPLAKPSERSGVVFGYADDDPAVYHDMFHASTTLSSRFEKVAFAYDTSARMVGVAYSGFKGGSS